MIKVTTYKWLKKGKYGCILFVILKGLDRYIE